jgi:hypothetical protein
LNAAMPTERVKALVEAFSVSRRPEIDSAWEIAHSMSDELLVLLAEAFPQIRKSAGRASIMRYVGKFSRENEFVFGMGIVAVQDRSYEVRHYGCALLAYSLRNEALPTLTVLLRHSDHRTVADARAAIDAIKRKNHYFFMDRDHSGKIRWDYASI